MISRSSCAMKRMKFTTCSGLPVNFSRSRGSCVATPAGQVFRWQTRIMMQPIATSGAVAKPNSSAPSNAAMTTSRPVFSWPSVSTTMRRRRLLSTSVWCVSARPSSHGRPACLMRGLRRGAGAAVVAADQHHVRVRLGDAGGDRADADFGHQLHADARVAVGVLQIVDQLRQIFDRINVVMRRRRDESDAGRGVPRLRDPRIHLGAGQLAAFAGLRALRHLDLQFPRVDQVVGW